MTLRPWCEAQTNEYCQKITIQEFRLNVTLRSRLLTYNRVLILLSSSSRYPSAVRPVSSTHKFRLLSEVYPQ
ncbi:hypothetical protein HYQ45_006667 [Verticillium longisporum]|uniref:Uncharacterized protein n=1 Tax=Verticillium longisporum TaxID=100787 RepID=A0A8I2ZP38_VERLO|nr:hypothetical protein HYQ45_006667 [Verticillium longisporum]